MRTVAAIALVFTVFILWVAMTYVMVSSIDRPERRARRRELRASRRRDWGNHSSQPSNIRPLVRRRRSLARRRVGTG